MKTPKVALAKLILFTVKVVAYVAMFLFVLLLMWSFMTSVRTGLILTAVGIALAAIGLAVFWALTVVRQDDLDNAQRSPGMGD